MAVPKVPLRISTERFTPANRITSLLLTTRQLRSQLCGCKRYGNVMLTGNAYAFAQINNERSGSTKALLPEGTAAWKRRRHERETADAPRQRSVHGMPVSIPVSRVLPHFRCRVEPRDIGSNRARKSSKPARPYIWRLSVFSRLM
jgi:hypothetical protein